MAPHGTAVRRGHSGVRRAPVHPRRVSGPVARPAVALPLPRRGGTGAFERLRALPEHRVVDGLLRGRVWIWVIGVMLGGIVAMQVSLLKLNAGISHSVEQAGALERVNADLETEVARLSAGERIQETAAQEGMVAPPAGEVGYLTVRPGLDPRLATDRMQAPSDEARQVMANGGKALAPVVAVTPTAPTTVAATTAPATTTVPPAPTATPAPPATPAPAAAVQPAPVTAGTGAATAPQG
jgi:hypothetical protein